MSVLTAAPSPQANAFDVAALQGWLAALPRPDGSVPSWVGRGAYSYPEAAALWLGAFAEHAQAPVVAAWLRTQLQNGLIGRDGVGYAFDTALADAMLRRFDSRGLEHRTSVLVTERRSCEPALPPRWSTTFAPHLLKRVCDCPELRRMQLPSGRFLTEPGNAQTYLHAHLYALEGLWLREGASEAVRRGLDWTASMLGTDGLPAWASDDDAFGPVRSDATAQALRLWALVDTEAYRRPLVRGWGALGNLQSPSGAIAYGNDCPHENTWASLFVWEAWLAFRGELLRDLL